MASTIVPMGFGVRQISDDLFSVDFLDVVDVGSNPKRRVIGSYALNSGELKAFVKSIVEVLQHQHTEQKKKSSK